METDLDESMLRAMLAEQREALARRPAPGHRERQALLAALEALIRENAEEIAAAIDADFGGRSVHETRLLEIFPSLEGIRHARRNLHAWMRPQRRRVSLWFQPGRAQVRHQPLGVVGIVVPWNYPLYLAVAPLSAALAAGNRALLKPSEFMPAFSACLAGLVERYFPTGEVRVVQGDAQVAQAFVRLPFDHLFFTGSTAVGRSVMRAAAENLTPVTLELGGKSPAILGPDFPMEKFAERVMIGKLFNAGQTCVAPDYVLLPAGREDEFVRAARAVVDAAYPQLERTADYSAIVSARHFARLKELLEEAQARAAKVVPLSASPAIDAARRRFSPFALREVPEDCRIMQEEIFGPLLPLVPYRDLDAAMAYVKARPTPLALYCFDRDPRRIERVLEEVPCGGVTVNDTVLHIAQDDLPFGGLGASGMGRYHGFEGFQTFSHAKSVFHQSRVNGMGLFKPPYGARVERLIRLLIR